jgi:hypothetical protein
MKKMGEAGAEKIAASNVAMSIGRQPSFRCNVVHRSRSQARP